MGCEVYANCNEIACKAGDNKVIAAFPDVCLSPPSPPAGPVPVPYPNTSFSRDLQNGSKTVKIKGQPVMLKDQSFHKTAPLGDEAATNGLGAGVITHVITGKTYCIAWSMDVKFEGLNVDRHTDLTTSNHASPMANRNVTLPQAAKATTSSDPKEKLCECCRARPPHTEAQAKGDTITEEEFYGPQNRNLLARVRANPKCKDLLPNPDAKGCNKYYRTKPAVVNASGASVERSEAWKLRYNEWVPYRPTYYKKSKVKPGTNVGHRVPLAAGGCPIGWGNLKPVDPECSELEGELSLAQERRSPARITR
jgi:Toxin PAAR-like domain